MVFKNGVINIEAAAYNGAHTVYWSYTDIVWNLNKPYQKFFCKNISLRPVVLPSLQFKVAGNLDQIHW